MAETVHGVRSGTGRTGEAAALAWYRRAGYRLVASNWRCPLGELDLVIRRGGTLVFCEVKARSGSALGGPFEAVTATKRRKLRQLAEAFLRADGSRCDEVRFDVASVTVPRGGRPFVHVFEDAF